MTKPHTVYSLWNSEGECLYVGQTINLRRRLQQHARQAAWWPTVEYIQPISLTNRIDANSVERALIRSYKPMHNQRHTVWEPHTIGRDLA